MPTVYSRLQLYKETSPIVLSRKKYRLLHNLIKNIYNRRETNPPPSYIQSIEDGVIFHMVRNYPDSLIPTIDGLIQKIAAASIQNAAKSYPNQPANPNVPKTVPDKTKKRKRIIKPAYSTRYKQKEN